MQKLSIVVPVFNEKGTIVQILEKLEKLDLTIKKEIIIVDDYSTDGTREILHNYENKYRIFYHDRNYGKGRALRTGFAAITGDAVVVQDADLEYDPNDFKIMLKKMAEGCPVIYGSRRLQHSYLKNRYSGRIFALGGIFITWLTNLLYGTKITDEPTCYKMFRSDLLPGLNLQCQGFEFCPEITAKIAKQGIKICEVPINYYPRHKDQGKKINWRDAVQATWTLLKFRFKK